MNLVEKQMIFARLIAQFILELDRRGYGVTGGEWWRPPETCALYAKQGRGIAGSLHPHRLAIDLNLFRAGTFLTKTEDYREAGEVWEGLSTPEYQCAWGGRFGDGNHFSIENGGVR